MTAARKPQSQGSRELMHEMSIWATQHRPKLILTEYMRRLVLAPVSYTHLTLPTILRV